MLHSLLNEFLLKQSEHFVIILGTNEIASAYTIETWRHSVYREFAWSKEQHAWRRIWHNLAWSETERERFRQTFPLPAQVQETPPSATQPLPDEDAERKRA